MRGRRGVVLSVVLTLVVSMVMETTAAEAWATSAAVDEASLVSLQLLDCERFSEGEINRILGIELRTIAGGREDVTAKPSLVRVHCDAAQVHLDIDHGGGTVDKRIVVTEEMRGEDPERLIALTAAELVLLSWVHVKQRTLSPEVPEKKPPPSKEIQSDLKKNKKESPSKRERLVSVDLGALWRIFFEGLSNSFGGELSLSLHPRKPLFLRTAVTIEGGRATRTSGDVSEFAAGGAASVGLEKWVFKERWSLGGEIGMRVGYGRLKGMPRKETAKGRAIDGSFGGPAARLSLVSRTKPYLGFSVETGYAPWGVTGDVHEGDPVALKRFWLGAQIIIGFSL